MVRERGLTFIELLIAATMTSVLFMGLGAHLRNGVLLWRRAAQASDALQRRRIALDQLERDLANAFVYEVDGTAYGSEPGKLAPISFAGSSLQWYTLEPGASGHQGAVRYVTYGCRAGNESGEEREEEVTGLWRTSRSIGQVRAQTEVSPTLLLPGCGEMRVRYAYLPSEHLVGAEWHGEWKDDPNNPDDQLPRLVEVTVTVQQAQSRRLCAIPAGVLKTFAETTP